MNHLFFVIALFGWDHGLYVSVTELKHRDNQTWEISCRVFDTDLEDGIRNMTGQSVSLRTAEELAKSEALVAAYIREKLQFFAPNGNALQMTWVRGKAENDTVWSYFTLQAAEISAVHNSLLIELFSDQQNVVSIERDGEKQFLRFNSELKSLQLD